MVAEVDTPLFITRLPAEAMAARTDISKRYKGDLGQGSLF